jgi:hypothetical protein
MVTYWGYKDGRVRSRECFVRCFGMTARLVGIVAVARAETVSPNRRGEI